MVKNLANFSSSRIFWFAQRNSYDLIYLTVFEKHTFLIDLLSHYGFQETKRIANGELVLEKIITNGALPALASDVLEYDRRHYPRFYDGSFAQKFIVPIQPNYHRRLFPEIAFGVELPLFPNEKLVPAHGPDRAPGNTIRKVYLCRAQTKRLRPGDILAFYMSKDIQYAGSQSITTVGVIEQVTEVQTGDDLIRATAKRSVFSAVDLSGMASFSNTPVKVIDFLLLGHLEPPITLQFLKRAGILLAAPQSITSLDEARYVRLRKHLNLGFAL